MPYSQAMTGIVPISFTIPGLDEFVYLERSYLEIDLKLNSAAANGLVANANSASDANNSKFVYVTNNLPHGLFKQINLRLGDVFMSEQTDTYMYMAFIETVLNYSRDKGATLLGPQGWVNYLNVTEQLAAAVHDDDICTTVGWRHSESNALKKATVAFHGNNKAKMIMHPHLPPCEQDVCWHLKWKWSWNCFATNPSSFCLAPRPAVRGQRTRSPWVKTTLR